MILKNMKNSPENVENNKLKRDKFEISLKALVLSL